jgi:hypothetical protein
MFSLLPPSLLRWLSDASAFPFTIDANERLRFTIGITRQSIYWSGGQTAEALLAPGRCAGQLAVSTYWSGGQMAEALLAPGRCAG